MQPGFLTDATLSGRGGQLDPGTTATPEGVVTDRPAVVTSD